MATSSFDSHSRFLSRARRSQLRGKRSFEQLDERLLLAADTCPSDEPLITSLADRSTIFAENNPTAGNSPTAQNYHATDAGSTMNTAYDLGTLGTARSLPGMVGGYDPSDVLQFTISDTSNVDLQLSGLWQDIDLYLFDSSGHMLAVSNRGGSASENISGTLDAGNYYLLVTPWRGAMSSYTITVGATSLAPVVTPPVTTPPTTTNPPATDPPTTTDPSTPVSAFPDVAYYGGSNDWNLNAINAPESWAQGYTGSGVVVAVVDTGVDINHPDLMSQIWVNSGEIPGNGIDDDRDGYVDDVNGWDFVSYDNTPDDGNGHGTHVAGTIAAEQNGTGSTGVAPGATIMPIRVLDNNGSGSADNVAAGIRFAADHGASIINLSLGGSYSAVILSAIQYAASLDVLVVAAAGNDGASTPGYPAQFSASLTNVISVGAYASGGALASFSNDVGNSGAVQVDAPGVSIYSTYAGDTYDVLSGTSMATPHVAGLAALALSANPNLTAAELRTLIVEGANLSIAGSDSQGGINAALTVALAAAGQVSGTSTSQTTSATVVSNQSTSLRHFMGSSSIRVDFNQIAAATQTHVSTAISSQQVEANPAAANPTAAMQTEPSQTVSQRIPTASAIATSVSQHVASHHIARDLAFLSDWGAAEFFGDDTGRLADEVSGLLAELV